MVTKAKTAKTAGRGFTLVEISVVISVIAILCAIAYPLAAGNVRKAREAALRQDLRVMREAIDKYHAAFGRYPRELDDLVKARFLRAVPPDPIAGTTPAWKAVPSSPDAEDVFDVRSAAPGNDLNDVPYDSY